MMMPPDLRFSQSSLQDYLDCPRRFQLRHLMRLAWPAIESEPVLEQERFLRLGALFHRMVQQHGVGVPLERLSALAQAQEGDLPQWWDNYLASGADLDQHLPAWGPAGSSVRHYEASIACQLADAPLVARFDRLDVRQGFARIIDWKTTRKRPGRKHLEERLQTRLYLYLLARAGSQYNQGAPFAPENIQMVYWFSASPSGTEVFSYSSQQFASDEAYFARLLRQIRQLPEQGFELTQDLKRCEFCKYRSLCGRGLGAGTPDPETADEAETSAFDQAALDLDLEQIGEIAF